MSGSPLRWLIRSFSVIAPMYAIYMPGLHGEPRAADARTLWRCLAVGAVLWGILAVVLRLRG